MIQDVVQTVYRGVMAAAAGTTALAATLSAAPVAWRRGADRLGRLTAAERATAAAGPVLWFHAASVGELRAVRPLLSALRARRPGRVVLATTLTRTGLALARELPEVDVASAAPARRARSGGCAAGRPDAGGVLLHRDRDLADALAAVAARGAPAFMVSGRVSARTAARARWLRPLYARALADVTCCMQSPDDAAPRACALGADLRPRARGRQPQVRVRGERPAGRAYVRSDRGWATRPLLVAGSTHEGEEDGPRRRVRAPASRDIRRLVLLLAPRHPERLDGVAGLVRAHAVLPLVRTARSPATGRRCSPRSLRSCCSTSSGRWRTATRWASPRSSAAAWCPSAGTTSSSRRARRGPSWSGRTPRTWSEVVERLLAAGGAPAGAVGGRALALAVARAARRSRRGARDGRRARARRSPTGEGAVERHLKMIEARLGPAPARAATA